jgi:hypothetical protein
VFSASYADPAFPRKYPAFIFYPFLSFFVAVTIFTILLAVFCSFDLAFNRILISVRSMQAPFIEIEMLFHTEQRGG